MLDHGNLHGAFEPVRYSCLINISGCEDFLSELMWLDSYHWTPELLDARR